MHRIRHSLAGTLSFFIAIILMVVFLLIGILTYNFTTQKLETDLLEKTYYQSQTISKDVLNIFENASLHTSEMGANRDIIDYLKSVKSREDITSNESYDNVLNYLAKVKASNSIHFMIWIASEEGNFYLDSSGNVPNDDYDVTRRPWYKIAKEADGVVFTPPYQEWKSKETVISSIVALRENGKVYGFAVVNIRLDAIPNFFEKSEHSEWDKSFMISEQGTYLYHEDASKVMTSSIFDADDPLNAYVSNILLPKETLMNIQYGDRDYYMLAYTIPINNWKVVTIMDKRAVMKDVYRVYILLALIMILAFLIAVISIHMLIGRSLKSYSMLVAFADRIAEGDYSNNIPDDFLKREDEMGSICHSFQKILESFRSENDILEAKIKQKNMELEQQYAYIIETEKAASLGNLVAGVAHEINTPLGVSISTASHIEVLSKASLDSIEKGTMTKQGLTRFFTDITEANRLLSGNLDRAANLVKSFKKIAVDQSSEVEALFILKEIFDDVILSLRGKYKRKNHKIELVCPPDLELMGYPGAYSQILTNLLMNSIEHGFDGRENGKIQIDCKMENDTLWIVYEDNGCGIPKENLKMIFEPFYTTNRQKGNSGLGMNVVYNIITQKLKGKIFLESEVNAYTRFTVEIPIQK